MNRASNDQSSGSRHYVVNPIKNGISISRISISSRSTVDITRITEAL